MEIRLTLSRLPGMLRAVRSISGRCVVWGGGKLLSSLETTTAVHSITCFEVSRTSRSPHERGRGCLCRGEVCLTLRHRQAAAVVGVGLAFAVPVCGYLMRSNLTHSHFLLLLLLSVGWLTLKTRPAACRWTRVPGLSSSRPRDQDSPRKEILIARINVVGICGSNFVQWQKR